MTDYSTLNRSQVGGESDPFTGERYQQFFRHFPANASLVLDVGCNTGRGGAVLKSLNQSLVITGIDCVANRLERLPPSVYSGSILGTPTAIPAPDRSFDVVVAGEFIEHLTVEDAAASLREFFRVLKSGGRLLLTTPNPGYYRLRLNGKSVIGGAHLSEHWPDVLADQLRAIGFVDIRTTGSGRVSRYLGTWFPLRNVYGSYLMQADRP